MPAAEIIARYRDEIAKADAIIAATPIDAMPKWWPDFFTNFPPRPLRRTILHVIAETATHAGQLYLGRVDAGYPIPFGRFTVVPVASFDWDHLDQDGYSESSMLGSGHSGSGTPYERSPTLYRCRCESVQPIASCRH